MFFKTGILVGVLLALNFDCRAETRLLTGTLTNQVHAGGGEVMDVSPDGDLVLFYGRSDGAGGLPETGLYIRSLSVGTLEYVSDPVSPAEGITGARMSDDGRFITWAVAEDREIYWRDRQEGITRWITEGQRIGREPFEVISSHPVMSADGRYVAFASNSLFLEPVSDRLAGVGYPAVHLYDSQNQSIRVVSLTSVGQRITTLGSVQSNTIENYGNFDMTPDAKYIVFATDSPTSHPDRANIMFGGNVAVLRRNIQNGQTVLLNRNSSGVVCNGSFNDPRISADGDRVVFRGEEVGVPFGPLPQTKMVSTLPANYGKDLYVKEISSGEVWALTRTASGLAHAGSPGSAAGISDDGSKVAFSSNASDLVPGGSGSDRDAFLAELGSGGSVSLAQISVSPGGAGNVSLVSGPWIAGDGSYVSFGTEQFGRMGFPGSSVFPHSVGVGTFPPLPNPAGAYETWAEVLPEGQRGATDNPSGDGVPNLLKYVIGSDGRVPDLRFLPRQEIKLGADVGAFLPDAKFQTMVVRIRRSVPRATWRVESAGTLDSLVNVPGPTLQVGAAVPDGDFDVYRFMSFAPLGDQGYMRLRVELEE